MNAIELRNLTKIYGNRYIALSGVDLAVPQGSVFGLLGPNGAGKTTTIGLILGLQRPTGGSVCVFGEPMKLNSAHLRRRIGYLPTHPRFPKDMTPITYLDLVGRLSGIPGSQRKTRLANLLRAVELLPAASQKLQALSTGMTTRLGIAASLIHDPDLLIWDEPTLGLDPEGRRFALDLIRSLAGEMRHPITRNAGTLTGALNDYDYIDDSYEADHMLLRAPGGLQEVVYLLDPRRGQNVLWRGVKSPIGGPESLFMDDNLYVYEELERWYQGYPLEGLPLNRCRRSH